jgi:PAS domain S-box-containing protein
MELQADGETLLVRAGVGWKPGVVGHQTVKVVRESSEGYALKTGQPVASDDIALEKRFTYAAFIQEHGVRALANVPIKGRKNEQGYGILEVDSRTPKAFDSSDIQFLRTYSNLIAAAVNRFKSFEKIKQSETLLQKQNELHQISASLNPQIPWTADTRGHITGFDGRWLELTGLSLYDALNEGWKHAPHPDDLPQMDKQWKHSLFSGEPYDVQARLKTSSGSYLWHRVRAFPWKNAEGHIQQWHGTVENVQENVRLEESLRDWNKQLTARITASSQALAQSQKERDDAEEKLRQSQKMEAVGQLTGGIAHDFNNMLAGVTSSLELMQMRIRQERYHDIPRYMSAAMGAVNKAAALTHRLLAFSRQQVLEKKLIQPNRLITDIEELIRRTVGPEIIV